MRLRIFLIFLLSFGLSGCSLLESINPFSSTKKSEQKVSTTEQQQAVAKEQQVTPQGDISENRQVQPEAESNELSAQQSSVEILWQVPGEPIEKYHIDYGNDPANLDKHLEIPVSELEKVDDPTHGPLFRYVLTGTELGKSIYFTVQAENQYGLSPKSPVQEIK